MTKTTKPDYVKYDGKIYKEIDIEKLDKEELLDILKENLKDLKTPIISSTPKGYDCLPLSNPNRVLCDEYRKDLNISGLSNNLLSYMDTSWKKN